MHFPNPGRLFAHTILTLFFYKKGFAHLPTGLSEFPVVDESRLLRKMEEMGVKVLEFAKVVGQDPPKE